MATPPEYWETMWQGGVKPGQAFDVEGSHPVLHRCLAEGKLPAGRALVPGCGRGYDVIALAAPTRSAVGMDLAPTGVAAANEYLAATLPPQLRMQAEVVVGDFFALLDTPSYDVVYDYTFLCAIQPSQRAAWAAKMAAVVRPGGRLLTLQFPLGVGYRLHASNEPPDWTKGPPFLLGLSTAEPVALYHELLDGAFTVVEEGPVPVGLSPPSRAGFEAFALWERRA